MTSTPKLQVLSVASEIFPLIKTGGLADVTGALPAALAHEGIIVRTLVPGYPSVVAALKSAEIVAEWEDFFGFPSTYSREPRRRSRSVRAGCPAFIRPRRQPLCRARQSGLGRQPATFCRPRLRRGTTRPGRRRRLFTGRGARERLANRPHAGLPALRREARARLPS